MRTVCRVCDPKSFYQNFIPQLNDDPALGLELLGDLSVKIIFSAWGHVVGNEVRLHQTLNFETPQAFEENFQSDFIGK